MSRDKFWYAVGTDREKCDVVERVGVRRACSVWRIVFWIDWGRVTVFDQRRFRVGIGVFLMDFGKEIGFFWLRLVWDWDWDWFWIQK